MTPREAEAVAAGVNERLRIEHNERFTAAYLAGTLPNAKRVPPLSKFLISAKRGPGQKQPWQAIKAALMAAMPPPE